MTAFMIAAIVGSTILGILAACVVFTELLSDDFQWIAKWRKRLSWGLLYATILYWVILAMLI